MPGNLEPITLIATFRAVSGQGDEVRRLIRAYGDVVRDEPGNVFFDIYTDRDDSHSFVIIEKYLDQQAFEDHLGGQEGKAFNKVLGPLVEGGGSELQFLHVAG
jgi:quinol monooxygenase YgiN